ncbi:urea ABC transporter permease subunit UrtB [Comamonas testosteroni]|uniref:Urea ABC transporter permease subunit UrtB n=1 Tax=Comamonas testosteroni TaxID=285 RepID=A0A373FG47_COMTE|nr:urea ABC transporter permease subunit UrtB [Comamonas testosteroni]RGE42967.1 urea ABC transporter permease subunit UrtB [Comamonas testosteroni]
MNFLRKPWLLAAAASMAGFSALLSFPSHALTAEQAFAMAAAEDAEQRAAAINQAVLAPDAQSDGGKLAAYLTALANDEVKTAAGKAYVVSGDAATDPTTGEAAKLPADAEEVVNNNYMRSVIDTAQAALALGSSDVQARRSAAEKLAAEPDAERLPVIEKALAAEKDEQVIALLSRAKAASLLGSDDAKQRLQAVEQLAQQKTPDTQLLLNQRLSEESDPAVQKAIKAALSSIGESLAWGDRLGAIFSGISLGSVLLLAALGLAITYGLMGVINMAHGELIMIGAYATYVVQMLFQRFVPEAAFGWYLVVAIPIAFMASALVGAVLERGVIRFLYGRPLETLLATFGISLVLQQTVRTIFGAQNVGVENPAWMSGGITLLPNLTLPYNRIAIIVFAFAVLAGVAFMIAKTRLGLFVRGVTQNRSMASCVGVNTARTDTYAFALGSGIAGLAGCALSQIGNVGPDLGQNYIVDSFLVVVLGGVGQLAGTVYAALGLGVLSKLLEGWTGAVLAKIAVLLFIVIFIQKRPQGIFALKGRSAEA